MLKFFHFIQKLFVIDITRVFFILFKNYIKGFRRITTVNPDQQLIDYVSKNLNLGYDQQSITQTLLSSGYSQQQVNAAFDYLYAQSHYGAQQQSNYTPGGHTGNKQIALFAMIGVGIFLAVVSGILLFSGSGSSSTDFVVNPGQDTTQTALQETPTTQNPPTDTTTNPTNTGQPTTIPTDTSTTSSGTTSTGSTASSGTSSTTGTSISLSDGDLTRLEIDQQVREIAATQPEKALELCSQILARGGRSNCITRVALESKQPSVCESHTDVYVKDTCYMNFAIEEIGSIQTVCANVQDQFNQRSCVLLYNNFAESTVQAQAAVEQLPLAEREELLAEAQSFDGPALG